MEIFVTTYLNGSTRERLSGLVVGLLFTSVRPTDLSIEFCSYQNIFSSQGGDTEDPRGGLCGSLEKLQRGTQ